MNPIDIIVAVVVLWFAYKGFSNGLIIELTKLVALLAGAYAGLKFSDGIASMITDKVDESYVPILSFSITFILVVLGVYLIGKILSKIIDLVALGLVNKLAGALFSALKVGLSLAVLTTIVESYDSKLHLIPEETKTGSIAYPILLDVSTNVLPKIEKNNLFIKSKEHLNNFEL